MNLQSYLQKRLQERQREHKKGFYTRLGQGRFVLYLLERIWRPLGNALYQTVASLVFWTWVSLAFPIFSWSDVIGHIQLLFAWQILLQGLLEAIRADFRTIHFRNTEQSTALKSGIYPFVFFLSLLPFLYILFNLWLRLHFRKGYFGVYDAMLLVASGRIALGMIPKTIQATLAPAKRLPLFWYNWLLGPLFLLTVSRFTLLSIGPWALPLTLALESVFSFCLQILRLHVLFGNLPWFHRPRLHFQSYRKIISSTLARMPSSLPPVVYHVLIGTLLIRRDFSSQEAVGIHALTGLITFSIRSPWMFWKELWDHVNLSALWLKFETIWIVGSAVGFTLMISGVFPPELSRFIFLISLLPWIQLRLLRIAFTGTHHLCALDAGFILAAAAFGIQNQYSILLDFILLAAVFISFVVRFSRVQKQLVFQSAFNFALTFRKKFWKIDHLHPALTELSSMGMEYRAVGHTLEVAAPTFNKEDWLRWGRGWVIKAYPILTTTPVSPQAPYQFDLSSFSWKTTPPPLKPEELHTLFKTVLHRTKTGPAFGKLQLEKTTLRWEKKRRWLEIKIH